MKTGRDNSRRWSGAVSAAALALVCLTGTWASAQHGGGQAHGGSAQHGAAPAARGSAPAFRNTQPRIQPRFQSQNRPLARQGQLGQQRQYERQQPRFQPGVEGRLQGGYSRPAAPAYQGQGGRAPLVPANPQITQGRPSYAGGDGAYGGAQARAPLVTAHPLITPLHSNDAAIRTAPSAPANAPVTPARPTYAPNNAVVRSAPAASAPPGHLGAWLNEHRGSTAQEQERTLRSEPSFKHLPQAQQQRLVDQLHHVNQLPEEQRQRRLARAEVLEHMSPQERMKLNLSGQRLAALPPERQALVKGAFRDLRSVPLDQRATVLNSARYQGAFSPGEREILSDFLRAEPYEPAR